MTPTTPVIPEIFDGKPTQYKLFNGCRTLGTLGKVVYVSSVLLSVFIIPALCEYMSFEESKQTAKKALLHAYGVADDKGNVIEERQYRPHTSVPRSQILQRMIMG